MKGERTWRPGKHTKIDRTEKHEARNREEPTGVPIEEERKWEEEEEEEEGKIRGVKFGIWRDTRKHFPLSAVKSSATAR